MSIVSSTSVITLEPQVLDKLRSSEFVHTNRKKLIRKRHNDAFNHIIWKMPNSGIVFLIYASGKCVILGAKSLDDLDHASIWISQNLQSRIVTRAVPKNMVYVYSTSIIIVPNLITELVKFIEKSNTVSYVPEQSPAIIVNPRCKTSAKAMVFRSGKIIITGVINDREISDTKSEISGILREFNSYISERHQSQSQLAGCSSA